MPEYSEVEKKIFVIGHKNPDTDSICSAIAYAGLKNETEENVYIPARAGDITGETKFVLDYFGVPTPRLCTDVGIQLKDIELRKMGGVSGDISLKEAWNLMRDAKIDTLPIVNHEEKLLGLITVKVIATSYMDIYDNNILALSKTPYTNILKTLDGEMVVGDSEDFVENGNIIIAAANPDVLENVIKKGDIVILGNRYEAQLCSIEMEAGTLIVCMDAIVSKTIKALAKARGCRIIKTPYDTYMAARLISQSAPISYFMKKDGLVSFNLNTSVDSASAVMASERHRYFPVLDMDGNYFAMLSRRNLLNKKPKQLILVDHNEKTQAANGI
ncbi:MAG: putative manganese-dependent inorganic diphosphatase, partial [Oscillospiraceae bacterium]